MYLLAWRTQEQSVCLGFQSLHNILSGTVQELMEKSMYYCINLCNNLEKSRDGSRIYGAFKNPCIIVSILTNPCNNLEKSRDGSRIDGAVKRERKGDADNCGADIQMVRTTQILQRLP